MTHKNTENNLSRITADILALPHYNSKFPFASIAAQIQAVDSRLKNLVALNFDIKQPIKDHYSVIPNEIDNTRDLLNFGQAASDCLSCLASAHDELNIIVPLVMSFLEAVKLQAQECCDKIAEETYKRDAQAREEYNKRFQEYVDDLEQRQSKLDSQFKNTQAAVSELKTAANDIYKSVTVATQAVNDAKGEAERAHTAAEDAQAKADEVTKQTNEAKDIANGMIPNMLTVLGIFVGVIVAVVACYLAILLEENNAQAIAAESIPLAFMFAWMMGHILMMSVFLLLYLTSKITNRTLACHCRYYEMPIQQPNNQSPKTIDQSIMPECINCKNNCKSLIRLKFRFPYVFWINIAFIVGYVIWGIIYLVDTYYAEHINHIIQLNWISLTVFAVIVLAAVIISTAVITKTINKESP